jgi:cell wall-associated NlpC family hydrolase
VIAERRLGDGVSGLDHQVDRTYADEAMTPARDHAGPTGTPLETGDLVFFGTSDTAVDRVGMYMGTEDGDVFMVDAPYTGADVWVQSFPITVGASFGDLVCVGVKGPSQ